jgi:hypothetical protein
MLAHWPGYVNASGAAEHFRGNINTDFIGEALPQKFTNYRWAAFDKQLSDTAPAQFIQEKTYISSALCSWRGKQLSAFLNDFLLLVGVCLDRFLACYNPHGHFFRSSRQPAIQRNS